MTTGRWAVVAAWLAVATALVALAPTAFTAAAASVSSFRTTIRSRRRSGGYFEEFRVPLLSGTTVVVHQPGGLSLLTQADSYLWALATTQDNLEGRTPPGPDQIIAAIPVPTGRSDTTVTYLYGSEGTGTARHGQAGDQYAAHFQNQPSVQTLRDRVRAGAGRARRLPECPAGLFELASLILILTVVALGLPLPAGSPRVVGIAAIGYLVYLPVLTMVASALGFEVPGQLEPVLLALLLGVITDYCVLFFHTFRDELDTGPRQRVRRPQRHPTQRLRHRRGRLDRRRRHHRPAGGAVRDLPGARTGPGPDGDCRRGHLA